ncbi:MAG TPA: UDP-N-acetylmuramate dehydrogenase [Pirellulaceae bacterium]|nr:UDP-N-acetylmuramate dehydrogenase [Pirellulaceae bacterium]
MAIPAGFEHIVRENEPLAPYTWFRLGGRAAYFAEPTNVEELAALVRRCHEGGLPVRVLGGGSNLLVRDEGVPGMVVALGAAAFGRIEVAGRKLIAGGGAKLGHVISTAVREGLAGLEMLVGIPGSVGGALHANAGTHAGDIGQCATSAAVMTSTGDIVTRQKNELRFGYRASSLDELVILEATFELEPGDSRHLTKQMQQAWILKRAEQPLSDQQTGQIFKSPGGSSAAKLIEDAELDDAKVGHAEISERNANFIVAGPQATSRDVLELIELVRKGVAERTGVELELAVEIW